jgi:hypothetical protein
MVVCVCEQQMAGVFVFPLQTVPFFLIQKFAGGKLGRRRGERVQHHITIAPQNCIDASAESVLLSCPVLPCSVLFC